MNDLLSRITIRAEQCHGQPCIRGMRIPVSLVINLVAHGKAFAQIIQEYPDLEIADIRQSLEYAARWTKSNLKHSVRPSELWRLNNQNAVKLTHE
ncbi:MAG: DUF433 domain-containing protein [Anaerolineae bacterium]|nr:DUF433 domain-containing protein [Anaerolineae bacterium]